MLGTEVLFFFEVLGSLKRNIQACYLNKHVLVIVKSSVVKSLVRSPMEHNPLVKGKVQ